MIASSDAASVHVSSLRACSSSLRQSGHFAKCSSRRLRLPVSSSFFRYAIISVRAESQFIRPPLETRSSVPFVADATALQENARASLLRSWHGPEGAHGGEHAGFDRAYSNPQDLGYLGVFHILKVRHYENQLLMLRQRGYRASNAELSVFIKQVHLGLDPLIHAKVLVRSEAVSIFMGQRYFLRTCSCLACLGQVVVLRDLEDIGRELARGLVTVARPVEPRKTSCR